MNAGAKTVNGARRAASLRLTSTGKVSSLADYLPWRYCRLEGVRRDLLVEHRLQKLADEEVHALKALRNAQEDSALSVDEQLVLIGSHTESHPQRSRDLADREEQP